MKRSAWSMGLRRSYSLRGTRDGRLDEHPLEHAEDAGAVGVAGADDAVADQAHVQGGQELGQRVDVGIRGELSGGAGGGKVLAEARLGRPGEALDRGEDP